jgi:NAD(P)-dependent dehydrogenase (short-subunit alcohol dehydrogenase family)
MKRTFLFAVGGLALGAWGIARFAGGRFSFADKVILITGGSRGLGLVIARYMAREGSRIALLARDQAELDRACDDLEKHGAKALAIRCDLLERTQIKEAVGRVLDHFGTIDVLINNAGIIEVGPLENMEREDFKKAMNLHLWAPFHLMWEIIPHMRRRGTGRIVNISSIGGKIAVPHLAPYSTSKFALVGLSAAMRNELARDGILVTTVAPGMMRTGSHVNAKFKGEHAAEFAWFSASAG